MVSASAFYVQIFACASCYRIGSFVSLLIFELQWTLHYSHWTIHSHSALLVPFSVHPTCKSALAAGVLTLLPRRFLFQRRVPRYGARVAVAGRGVVPHHVTSGTPELKSAQRQALRALESEPGTFLTRSEYERLTGVGRSQAAYDLSELVSAGRLIRVGGGRSTRYALAHEPASQRRWTGDRIRRELAAFCANRRTWPTASEFKTAGRGDLYVAASRYGGVKHWANELGLERFDRSRTAVTATRAPLRSRLAWGLGGALAATALAAAAVTAVVRTHDFGSGGTAAVQASVKLPSAFRIVYKPLQLPRVKPDHASRPRPNFLPQSTPAQQTSLVSVQTVSAHATPTTRTTLAATASTSGGPAPLPAPTGASSAPSALKAP